ncbi:MAG: hypothetical protein WDN26_04040 [Chitinophagaceae bacterium]
MERIQTIYSLEKNIDDYEQAMLNACTEKLPVSQPSITKIA